VKSAVSTSDFQKGVSRNGKTRQVLAGFVSEVSRVAAAAGHNLDTVEGIKVDDWEKYAACHMLQLGAAIETAGAHFPMRWIILMAIL